MSCLTAAVGVGFSVLGEGDFDVDELIAGALAVRARIVQSSALKLSTKPARFATRRSATPVSCGRFQISPAAWTFRLMNELCCGL